MVGEQIELKDYLRETNLIHARLIMLGVILAFLTFTLIGRVWYLQVYQNERFEVLSKDNRVRLVPVPPVRGQIFDRNGKVLAENIPVFTLEIRPIEVDDMDALLDELFIMFLVETIESSCSVSDVLLDFICFYQNVEFEDFFAEVAFIDRGF